MFMLPHKIGIAIVILLLWAGLARAADATFSWLPNPEPDLAGYAIHCGTEPGVYTFTTDTGLPDLVSGRVQYTMRDIPDGTYYCAATARDTEGMVSDYSNEVSTNQAPGAVQEFRVIVTVSVEVVQ